GIGCEPASACTLAGVTKLRRAGVVQGDDRVACVLTGHVLKDPDIILKQTSPRIIEIDANVDEAERALRAT
ncbi:MAG TPA: threonine synthase, partial [Rhodothermia bacterium]|nr:threonine synthase [Rhodothermia bacterium]